MGIIEELQNALYVMLFSQKAIADVAKRDTTWYAVGFLIASSIIVFFLNMFSPEPVASEITPLVWLAFVILLSLFFVFITCCIFHATALLFKGTGSIVGLFRASGYVAGIGILQGIFAYMGYVPYLSVLTQPIFLDVQFSIIDILFSLYSLIFYTFAISTVENLPKWKSALVWIIPAMVFMGFALFLILAMASLIPPI